MYHVRLVVLQVGLNVLIQKASGFSPTTRLLVQRFIPFPAVGEFKELSQTLHGTDED